MDRDIIAILQILLNNRVVNIKTLQEESDSSKRQVNYRLNKINEMIKLENNEKINIGTSKDICITPKTRQAIKAILEKNYSRNTYYFGKEERLVYMYLMLFISKDYISINHFMDSMKVSRSTVNLDLKDLIPELEKSEIYIKNNRVNGYYLVGSEKELRRVAIKNIIEMLSSRENSRVLDLFIEEYNLDNFENSKKIISELLEKHNISFVENRLLEFIYIFIFLKARMSAISLGNLGNIDIPNINIMKELKEYRFTEELIEKFQVKDKIHAKDLMYISAWIIGISVGDVQEETKDKYFITEIVNKIIYKFQSISGISCSNYIKIFNQLYSHFRPAYYRLIFKLPICNALSEKVKVEYELVYKIVSNTMKEFYALFGEEIQEEELAYLTLHFATIFSGKKEYEVIDKKIAVILCSNGVGSSAILYAELQNLFPEIHFLPPLESVKLGSIVDKVDIIFTTNYVELETDLNIPVIRVSPVMTSKEKYKVTRELYIQLGEVFLKKPKIEEVMDIIKKHANVVSEDMLIEDLLTYFTQIENLKIEGVRTPMLSELTNESLIKLKISAKNWEDAIRQSASVLIENGKATAGYVDEIVKTAKEAGPYIVITKHVALPHARPEAGAKEIAIGIATLESPVVFGNIENDPVKYIFCLSAVDNSSHLRAMSELVELLSMDTFYEMLENAKDPKEIMDFIKQNESRGM